MLSRKVSLFWLSFGLLLLTYVVVASLIAFFTVKIIGVPIGQKMTTKIILSIAGFMPVYVLLAFLLSRIISREIEKLSRSAEQLPFNPTLEGSFIKEVDSLANTIESQSNRILEILEAQRFLLLRLAHDLRTPISNLRNVLQGIKEGVIDSSEIEDYVSRLILETEKMEVLLEEVLSDMRKTVRKTEPEETDLGELLKELVDIWRFRFSSKGINLELELVEGVKAYVSPIDLREALNNIIENAYKNTQDGEVKIYLRNGDTSIEICVEDRGSGIEEGKIMQAYKEGRLGLYITRELLWRNGGSLKISRNGKGSCFIVTFPKTQRLRYLRS